MEDVTSSLMVICSLHTQTRQFYKMNKGYLSTLRVLEITKFSLPFLKSTLLGTRFFPILLMVIDLKKRKKETCLFQSPTTSQDSKNHIKSDMAIGMGQKFSSLSYGSFR